jgi:uncharacterized protein (TIGR00297 family)
LITTFDMRGTTYELPIRVTIALIISIILAYRGYRKKSLSISGSFAAFLVGLLSFGTSYRFGIILIVFYVTSSRITKIREDVKARLEYDYQVGGQRTYIQVFASSLLASLIIIIHLLYIGDDQYDICFDASYDLQSSQVLSSLLWSMYIAHYSAANGDTWASEIGVLSRHKPRLITTLLIRQVPPGTNGGMSIMGTLASGAGGGVIGIVYFFLSLISHIVMGTTPKCSQFPVILFGIFAGLFGSLVDSLLGATCQASYYSNEKKAIVRDPKSIPNETLELVCGMDILSNEMVNFLSIACTMVAMLTIVPYIFY